MKTYKDFTKKYIGTSDIASLILVKNEFKKIIVDEEITMTEVARRCNLIPQQFNNRFNNSRMNPLDMEYWKEKGWTKNKRPWKN